MRGLGGGGGGDGGGGWVLNRVSVLPCQAFVMWLSEDQRLSEGSGNRAPSPAPCDLEQAPSQVLWTQHKRGWSSFFSGQTAPCDSPAFTLAPVPYHTQGHTEETAETPWEERLSEKMPMRTQAWEAGRGGG